MTIEDDIFKGIEIVEQAVNNIDMYSTNLVINICDEYCMLLLCKCFVSLTVVLLFSET